MKNHKFIKALIDNEEYKDIVAFENSQTYLFKKKVFFASFICVLILVLAVVESWKYSMFVFVAFPLSYMFYGERLASVEKREMEKSLSKAWVDKSLDLLRDTSLGDVHSLLLDAKKITAHKDNSGAVNTLIAVVVERLEDIDKAKESVAKDKKVLNAYKIAFNWLIDVVSNEEVLRFEMEKLEQVRECSVYDDYHDNAHNPLPIYKRIG